MWLEYLKILSILRTDPHLERCPLAKKRKQKDNRAYFRREILPSLINSIDSLPGDFGEWNHFI